MPTIKKYVKTYNSRTLWGKLRVSRMLRKDSATAHFVPRTAAFSRKQLKKMASRFEILYIKPNIGSLGMGIHRLRRKGSGYELASVIFRKQISRSFGNLDQVYEHIRKTRKSGKLIIQRGIQLDRIEGKPYDIRAMVQRKPKGPWTCTALIVKVALPNRIVTNAHQGAKLYLLSKLWEMQGMGSSPARANNEFIGESALAISKSLSRRYGGMREMGIDFAIDRSKRLWVLEVNTNHPQYGAFKKIDRAVYNRVKSFARSYGRKDD
ncbi:MULTISPECIES: YheC/YheD family protein [unclassified Paenibacillus]|uniref:YheC/YheD family protein n=1 Tax=unclassified Paenibacillus TaxID=185978 RepID=UPI00095578C5|nr:MULTISPECIES: YheC/YheD family protein [unclassified Paenibacillus]ASS67276.1 hypothetical protein CIC07_14840 [Paenibacillus sp. RUD330]SIQ83090.1 YheC/D like ATP-grasp [Paenibacillus sp. RU4X]SIR04279.1 YheC/D like ATP-grasp [Paenibacillus sp. RU4T]